MDEQQILAAVLSSRSAYDKLAGKLDVAEFSEFGQLILRATVSYYARDPEAKAADRAVVSSSIQRMFPTAKQSRAVLDYLADVPQETSAVNVVEEYRLLRRHRVGLELAGCLGEKAPNDERIARLIDKYLALSSEERGEKPRPTLDDLAERAGRRMKLHPAAVNQEVSGGLLPGDHVVVFGRPNVGKSMFAINQAAHLVRQGFRVLYVCNEEDAARYLPRFIARLSGYKWADIAADPAGLGKQAEAKALENGLERLALIHEPSGKLGVIEALVRTHKPDVLFVDQMRGLKAGHSNRVQELEEVAKELRRMAGTYRMAVVSMTQAGDSADEKLQLGMGDIDWSNTGVQGACDLMIGIGADASARAAGRRMCNIVKNKIGPRDSRFMLFVEPQFNLYLSKPRRAA